MAAVCSGIEVLFGELCFTSEESLIARTRRCRLVPRFDLDDDFLLSHKENISI